MLKIVNRMNDFSFGKLMEVYEEGNLENGQDMWPDEPIGRQIALAEQEFYSYLRQVFFKTEGSVYLIWEEQGSYVSALRLEPYQDGLLLEALETAPKHRRKGFGARLVSAAVTYANGTKIYSHVNRKNKASLHTHEKCGFQRILEHAVYIDGTVARNAYTLCFDASLGEKTK
jgi:GNAT superfamily N-acetyltransferase